MVVPEGFERLRALRRERLDLLIAIALALITLGIELRPVRQPVARRPEADKDGKITIATPAVRIARLHEIGPVGLHFGRQRRLRGSERRAEVEDVLEFGGVLGSRREA